MWQVVVVVAVAEEEADGIETGSSVASLPPSLEDTRQAGQGCSDEA